MKSGESGDKSPYSKEITLRVCRHKPLSRIYYELESELAKYRHRLFEMFDFHDEACDALSTKGDTGSMPPVVPWEDAKLSYLTVQYENGLTKVSFLPMDASENDTRDYRNDIAVIASQVTRNNKLLFDFSGVHTFSDTSIAALGNLSNTLRHKGSRIVLCCLSDSAKACFFPTKR